MKLPHFHIFGNDKIELERVEPPFWWHNMQTEDLQLLVHGKNISHADVEINTSHAILTKISKVSNPNYLFIHLRIDRNTKTSSFDIHFKKGKKQIGHYTYHLYSRDENSRLRESFSSADAVYLIMPDRFANGNPQLNNLSEMIESVDRKKPYGRHGGDLEGIRQHLDYIVSMGFTAIWLNPIQENNQPHSSYHGYAITNYYSVDARLGSLDDFKNLVDQCKQKGIKIIMDMVFNHCGSHHWWMNDLPTSDWINTWPNYTQSNHRLATISDPYVSLYDINHTVNGWFDKHMPDLNLTNDFLQTYLIQNSIWWIEHTGIQGIRMDTYPYADKTAMANWMKCIKSEYPNFNVVGEAWISAPSKLAYWQKDVPNKDNYNSYLPSLMDFPLSESIQSAFNDKDNWHDGVIKLYNTLADDHLYDNPMNLMVFGENHDVGRLYYLLNKNIHSFFMALTFIATTRGIPQFYFGFELLMKGNGYKSHSEIRSDFPGGWTEDTLNAFNEDERTRKQNKVIDFISKLLNYRKQSTALKYGKLLHFIPQNEVYVYFRYSEENAVMIILNNSSTDSKIIDTDRFNEIIHYYSKGRNIITNKFVDSLKTVSVPQKSATIIELSN